MTAKRNDSGDIEIVKWGMGTKSFRVAVVLLIVSMHPLGRQMLSTFGFEFPDQKRLYTTLEQSEKTQAEVQRLSVAISDIKLDMREVQSNNIQINTKVDSLEKAVTGFQVDFNKYKITPTTK